MVKARKTRIRPIPKAAMPWLVEYLPEVKWDLPWNWKAYCTTFTKPAAEKVSQQLLFKGTLNV